MTGIRTRRPSRRHCSAWLALALVPMLSGCLGAAVIPILASGPLVGGRHVRAATAAPKAARTSDRNAAKINKRATAGQGSHIVATSLKELPAPTAAPAPDDPWQKFFAFALASPQSASTSSAGRSVLLVDNPPLDMPARRDCMAQVPAVIIDLDHDPAAFDPGQLRSAPGPVAAGLAKLRRAGIVILWISQLPAARAADVGEALRSSGLDPERQDQLLLIRGPGDRKEILRKDANEDVCVIAVAGDARHDFDELFDYLRQPDAAFGLDAMLDKGWFLVPPLEGPAPK
jgi:hypothetical protein